MITFELHCFLYYVKMALQCGRYNVVSHGNNAYDLRLRLAKRCNKYCHFDMITYDLSSEIVDIIISIMIWQVLVLVLRKLHYTTIM